jgi:hypothetical protein
MAKTSYRTYVRRSTTYLYGGTENRGRRCLPSRLFRQPTAQRPGVSTPTRRPPPARGPRHRQTVVSAVPVRAANAFSALHPGSLATQDEQREKQGDVSTLILGLSVETHVLP